MGAHILERYVAAPVRINMPEAIKKGNRVGTILFDQRRIPLHAPLNARDGNNKIKKKEHSVIQISILDFMKYLTREKYLFQFYGDS